MDKVSIITVCFNAQDYIERTMRSVLEQTYQEIEYIVVDGASKDSTVNIVKALCEEYKERNIVLISEPDRGIYDAMNKGIDHATGEWINFMNSGDRFASSRVLEEVFKSGIPSNKSFVYSDTYLSKGGVITDTRVCSIERGELIHQSTIYRRELHSIYGHYIVKRHMLISDYLFFLIVPEELYIKVDKVISIYDIDGVSQGEWCLFQKKCADYIFNKISLPRAFWDILKYKYWRCVVLPLKKRLKKT